MYEESLQAHALATEQSETQTKEALEAAWPGQEGDIESDAKSSSKQLSKTLALMKPFTFYRKNRVAWLDLHLGYALLCPAGAVGGDGASWWLLLAPVVMSLRFVGEKVSFLKPVRRVLAVVGGVVALGSVLFSASASLTHALTSARGGGWVGWVLSPIALAVTYFVYELISEQLGVGGLKRYDGHAAQVSAAVAAAAASPSAASSSAAAQQGATEPAR